MKAIIIGDVHDRVDWVEPFLKTQEPYDKVIFLGDYFNSWTDTANTASHTARWLKKMIHDPRNVMLYGNHDLSFAVPRGCTFCPGWDHPKHKAVSAIMKAEDWAKMKLVHFEDPDIIFSHAGLLKQWFEHPVDGITKEGIIKLCDRALEKVRGGMYDDILCNWGTRGGAMWPSGGIIWADWSELCQKEGRLKGWTQIVGHSTSKNGPRICKVDEKHVNICLDTCNMFYGTLINGVIDCHKNPYVHLKKAEKAVSGMCDTENGYGMGPPKKA